MKPRELDRLLDAPTLRAAIYLRRSTSFQEQSLDDQRAAVQAFAADAKIAIVREFVDDAVSGSTTEARNAFKDMIATAQNPNPEFQLVLCYDIKRFGRVDGDEAGYYRHLLRQCGIEVVYVSEGFSGDDSDDLLRPVKQWQARQELKDLAKVTLRGQISLADKGWWLGGVPPFAYDLEYVDTDGKPFQRVRFTDGGEKLLIDLQGNVTRVLPRGHRVERAKSDHARLVVGDPDRVRIVRRIFDLYANEGLGFKPIAHLLNAEKIASPRSGAWSSNHEGHWAMSTVRSIIVNQIYTGAAVWNRKTYAKFFRVSQERATARPRHRLGKGERNPETDWIVVPDCHEAIIAKELFERARSVRLSREKDHHLSATRGGRAKTSVFLLSGLIKCIDCGHNYQGYRVKRGKRSGAAPVETQYYCCGGYITKGNTVCRRTLLSRRALEEFILQRIGKRLKGFLNSGGRKLLERAVQAEAGPDGGAEREFKDLTARMAEIRQKIDSLLDSLTPVNKEFVDEKLRVLKAEKSRLEARLGASAAPRAPVDVAAIVDAGLARLRDLRGLLEHGNLEEQKTLVQSFVQRIELSHKNNTCAVFFYKLPANCSFELVAGARYEPLQIDLEPAGRFLAGLKRAA